MTGSFFHCFPKNLRGLSDEAALQIRTGVSLFQETSPCLRPSVVKKQFNHPLSLETRRYREDKHIYGRLTAATSAAAGTLHRVEG
jgi:hypothetical protein